jgi:hypothetical protein
MGLLFPSVLFRLGTELRGVCAIEEYECESSSVITDGEGEAVLFSAGDAISQQVEGYCSLKV